VLPEVSCLDAHWAEKQRAGNDPKARPMPGYVAVEIPRNTATGIICAFFATLMGFALIWHIWWLAALGGVGALATFVAFAWRDQVEHEIPAEELARLDGLDRVARGLASEGGLRS
jgi:cytochrome o ubiquinol oxidase subunit 1